MQYFSAIAQLSSVGKTVSGIASTAFAPNSPERNVNSAHIHQESNTILESITTAAFLALLGLNAYGEGAKLSFGRNQMIADEPNMLQGPSRWFKGESRRDIKKYKVLHIAIVLPQTWYHPGSEEAQQILRILKVAQRGLNYLKDMYSDDFLPDHVNYYLGQYERYRKLIEEPSEEPEEKKEAVQEQTPQVLSELMKECWCLEELIILANKLENAQREFNEQKKINPATLRPINNTINDKVETFRLRLEQDQQRYVITSTDK